MLGVVVLFVTGSGSLLAAGDGLPLARFAVAAEIAVAEPHTPTLSSVNVEIRAFDPNRLAPAQFGDWERPQRLLAPDPRSAIRAR